MGSLAICYDDSMSHDFRFMNADDVDVCGQEVLTVRPSTAYHLSAYIIFTLIFLGILSVILGYHYHADLPDKTPLYMTEWFENLDGEIMFFLGILEAFLLLFVLMARSFYRKSLNPRSWLLKATNNGLYIQFRSFLNQNFDEKDKTVLFIPAAQVSSVQEVRFTRVRKKMSNATEYEFVKVLDIDVRRLDMDKIQEEIHKELRRETSSRSRWNDSPVSIEGKTLLRLDWSGMSPGIRNFVRKMKRWYMTKPFKKLKRQDEQKLYNKVYDEGDILKALRDGQKIEAIAIARKVHGFGLKEAKEHVDNLDLLSSSE